MHISCLTNNTRRHLTSEYFKNKQTNNISDFQLMAKLRLRNISYHEIDMLSRVFIFTVNLMCIIEGTQTNE